MEEHGQKWAKLAQIFDQPFLTPKDIKYRYRNKLNPNLKRGRFTKEEDQIVEVPGPSAVTEVPSAVTEGPSAVTEVPSAVEVPFAVAAVPIADADAEMSGAAHEEVYEPAGHEEGQNSDDRFWDEFGIDDPFPDHMVDDRCFGSDRNEDEDEQ